MKINKYLALFSLLLFVAIVYVPVQEAAAQVPSSGLDLNVDAATRSAVVDSLLKQLDDEYVFPETAKKMEADIRSRQKTGEYDNVTSAKAFSEKLTADLQSVSHDKHLRVRYSPEPIPVRQQQAEPTADEKAGEARYVKFM